MLNKIRNNKVLKIIAKIIEILVFTLIGIYVLLTIFQKVSNNSSIFGYRMFTVASNSMKPSYEIGDVIVVKQINKNDLKVGDVVSYLGTRADMKDKIVTHRIISIDGDDITLKGDANTVEDPVINYSQIYGKVVYKTVVVTFVSSLVRNQFGFFFFIFAPIVIVVFLEVVDTIKDIKNKNVA